MFLDEFKRQENEQRLEYIKEIEEGVKKISRDETMSVFEACRLLRDKDPTKKANEVDEYVSRGFKIPVSDLKPKTIISKAEFVKQIRRGPLMKGTSEEKPTMITSIENENS